MCGQYCLSDYTCLLTSSPLYNNFWFTGVLNFTTVEFIIHFIVFKIFVLFRTLLWEHENILHILLLIISFFYFIFLNFFRLSETESYINITGKISFSFHNDNQLFQKTLFSNSSVFSNLQWHISYIPFYICMTLYNRSIA